MKNLSIALSLVITSFACSGGDKKTAEAPKENNPPENLEVETTISGDAQKGLEVYKKTCIACHQSNGEGIEKTFPPLAKSDFLADKLKVIEQVINGKKGEMVVNGATYNNVMPPQNLSDQEIADVLTYVYGNWGNDGTIFKVSEIKSVRENLH